MDNDRHLRADPDALLSAIAKKKRKSRGGRLYLFIGMAPGVGKTYAMLLAAKEAQKNDLDIVVGVVETHGRLETQALLGDLEIVGRKTIEYRERTFLEMDLDAILQRKPAIVLVDELAHTNVPGSRHNKRWQDVFEILDHGIDVYSTLNVQHLESRKDAVQDIAKITITETVPDSVLDRSFQIQLIDLSVPDLLRRLKDGKVYLGEKAELACGNFFKEDKLTALREIALRVVAERVDADLQILVPEREAGTIWPAAERVMVAVGFQSEKTIRAGRRIAYNLDAPWIAVHVTTNAPVSEQEAAILAKDLELARNLGAEVFTITDVSVADGLLRFTRQKDITQLILGRSSKKPLRRFFGYRSVFDQVAAQSSLDICVIGAQPDPKARIFAKLGILKIRSTLSTFIKACFFSAFLIGAASLLTPLMGYRSIGFVFMAAMLLLGLLLPIGPTLFSAFITGLGWNYYFIPEKNSFHINDHEDIFLNIFYLVAVTATALLTRRNRYQKDILVKREARSEALQQILFEMATTSTLKSALAQATGGLADFLEGNCDIALAKKDGSLSSFLEQRIIVKNFSRELAVAKWSMDNKKIAGRFTDTLSSAEALYIPLVGAYSVVGVLAFQTKKSQISTENMSFLHLIARQIATFIERDNFRKRAMETDQTSESEKMTRGLLLVLADAVRNNIPEQELRFLVDNSAIFSRISVGLFPLKKEPCYLSAIVHQALEKLALIKSLPPINIIEHTGLKTIAMERELLVQTIENILYYALKSGDDKADIIIEISLNKLTITYTSLVDEEVYHMFEKFYSSGIIMSDTIRLSQHVAKAIIKAHEGKISVSKSSNSVIIGIGF